MKYPCEYMGNDVATYGTQLDALATSLPTHRMNINCKYMYTSPNSLEKSRDLSGDQIHTFKFQCDGGEKAWVYKC